MVVDFRLLNNITETYKICLSKINDILQCIAGRQFYCVLDLKAEFFQIQLCPEDRENFAFCMELGNFQPYTLPCKAKNSTSYFHRLINNCLNHLKWKDLQLFLDDIVLANNSIQELKILMQKVFDRLKSII